MDVSNIFNFFLLSGVRGAGRGGGDGFLLKIPRGGGSLLGRWGGGVEWPGGWPWGIFFGGGAKFFFGAEIPTKSFLLEKELTRL